MDIDTFGESSVVAQSTLYSLIWAEFGICTVVILLRGYSQLLVFRRPCVDDAIMVGAYIMQAVASGLSTASTHRGLGDDLADLMRDPRNVVNMLKYAMISMPFGVLGPMLGRISFILFLQTTVLTVHNVRRKLLWGVIALQVIINVIPIILEFTKCKPVEALWDPFVLRDACRPAMVIQRYGYFQGAFNAFTDLFLIVIALLVIIHLKLRLQTKIALCLILSLSSFCYFENHPPSTDDDDIIQLCISHVHNLVPNRRHRHHRHSVYSAPPPDRMPAQDNQVHVYECL